jgi:DNA mismatch repair protein MutS
MPASLVRQARATLESLENQQRAADAQIDLFAPPAPLPEREPTPLERALSEVNPDTMSPKEALDALYRLKSLGLEDKS